MKVEQYYIGKQDIKELSNGQMVKIITVDNRVIQLIPE